MKNFSDLTPPAVSGLEIVLGGPNLVTMKGTITVQDGGGLSAFFRALHARARDSRVSEVVLDVSGLRFVNSSAIGNPRGGSLSRARVCASRWQRCRSRCPENTGD